METDWEALYQAGDTRWDKGEPSPGLVDFLTDNSSLPRGAVVVPGCGAGHDVREWARCGFRTSGLDIAPSAISRCEKQTPVNNLNTTYRLGNFLTDSPEHPFDWAFEHTFFCAISTDQRENYVNALARWLKPTGQFLAVHYFIPDKDGPPFGTTKDEVVDRFSKSFDLVADWIPRSYPNRTGLERMFWWKRR